MEFNAGPHTASDVFGTIDPSPESKAEKHCAERDGGERKSYALPDSREAQQQAQNMFH